MWHTSNIMSSEHVAHQYYLSFFCACGTPIILYCLPYVWHTSYIMSAAHVAHKYHLSFFCACGTPIILYCLPYVWHTNCIVAFSAVEYTNCILVSGIKPVLIKIRVVSYATLFDFTDNNWNILISNISIQLKVCLVAAIQRRISLIDAASLYSAKPEKLCCIHFVLCKS